MEMDYNEISNYSTLAEESKTVIHSLLHFNCIVAALCFLVALLGHATVAFLTIKRSTLQTIPNFYLLNISISHIIALLEIPMDITTTIKENLVFGPVMCIITSSLFQLPIFTNSVFLTFLAVDCYLGTRRKNNPNHDYRSTMLKIVTVSTWVAAGIFLVPIYFTTVYMSDGHFHICMIGPTLSQEAYVSLSCVCVLILVPVISMWLYISQWFPLSKPLSAPEFLESRRLVVALVLSFTLCHVPYWLSVAIRFLYFNSYLSVIISILPYANVAIIPILIAVFNKDMRLEFFSRLPEALSRNLGVDTP